MQALCEGGVIQWKSAHFSPNNKKGVDYTK